jgi:hypothetical protein
MNTSSITISFPLGLFGNATMNVPPANPLEEPATRFPLDRELLDMPNVIPETEGADEFFHLDDAAS